MLTGPNLPFSFLHILTRQGFDMIEDAGRGYRIVVPSPMPREIVEGKSITKMIDNGMTVVSCGGGGIPVVRENGELKGVNAVIDKDLCGELLVRGEYCFIFVKKLSKSLLFYRPTPSQPTTT